MVAWKFQNKSWKLQNGFEHIAQLMTTKLFGVFVCYTHSLEAENVSLSENFPMSPDSFVSKRDFSS